MTANAAGEGREKGMTGMVRFPLTEGVGLEGGSTGRRTQLRARGSAWTGKIATWSDEEEDFEGEMARTWVGYDVSAEETLTGTLIEEESCERDSDGGSESAFMPLSMACGRERKPRRTYSKGTPASSGDVARTASGETSVKVGRERVRGS